MQAIAHVLSKPKALAFEVASTYDAVGAGLMAQLLSGIFANMWRCKWTTTGIYSGSTTVQVNAYGTGELEPQLARCLIKRAPSKIQRDEARAGSGPLSSCRDSLPSRGGAEYSTHRRAGGQMPGCRGDKSVRERRTKKATGAHNERAIAERSLL
jgi:hypothetical protein